MFKYMGIREQLAESQRKNDALQAKLFAITEEVETETENGIEVVTKPLHEDEIIKNTEDIGAVIQILSEVL